MNEQNFGRLEKIDLREGWPSEAGHFTPWMASPKNLSLLGETIGIDLEPMSQEHPVGPYRADLVCQDTDTESVVLIENQLEKTNHKHLGQLFTYAAGLQAQTIVWVASQFTDEHKAALDWINDHTEDSIRVFGLEIELWRIGESEPAPKFNIVTKPNEWIKSGLSSRTSGTSERKIAQQEYWTAFSEWMNSHDLDNNRLSKPGGRHWMSIRPYKVRGMTNSLTIKTLKREIGVELYLGRDMANSRFAALESHKEEIEASFGESLDWQPLPHRIACRIKATLSDTDWKESGDWNRQFEWFRDTNKRLTQAILPHMEKMRTTTDDFTEA